MVHRIVARESINFRSFSNILCVLQYIADPNGISKFFEVLIWPNNGFRKIKGQNLNLLSSVLLGSRTQVFEIQDMYLEILTLK